MTPIRESAHLDWEGKHMIESSKVIASESTHWYHADGSPCYEVPYADPRKGMRPTTLSDARKLNLRRSVTRIINCAAKPGLENWKLVQTLMASLTLPRIDGESIDDFAKRVLEDSEAQGKKARDRGTALHEAIEFYVQGKPFDRAWNNHILAVERTLRQQCGLDLVPADAEKTFATTRYGGKIDWKQGVALADFKSKDRIENGKKLGFDNHIMQLAAYGKGCDIDLSDLRALSVFVGVEDEKVSILEWKYDDLIRGWQMFSSLLDYCELLENYKPDAQPE